MSNESTGGGGGGSQYEVDTAALRHAAMVGVDQGIVAQGDIAFPVVPAMLDTYVSKLANIFEALGQPFSQDDLKALRQRIEVTLAEGYRSFPNGKVIISYFRRPNQAGIAYKVLLKQETMADRYQNFVGDDKPPPFGKFPDAKVMAVAEELGDRSAVVLDIGAGTGRNALALARLGHPVVAMEPTLVLTKLMRKSIETEGLAVKVIEADVLAPDLQLESGRYRLVVLAELISHFRGVAPVKQLFKKLSDAVAPGGLVVVSTFLTSESYKPDALALQASETTWSYLFTPTDLEFIVDEMPFEKVSNESAHDYEKEHLPEGGWPPTPWFPKWSKAGDVFPLSEGVAPVELRWLVFRRK